MTTDNKLAEALHVLLAACDDSDSAMYGTIGVSFVRDVAQAALAEHDAKPHPLHTDREPRFFLDHGVVHDRKTGANERQQTGERNAL